METGPQVTAYFVLRPSEIDTIHPFAYSLQHVIRWTIVVFVCLVSYEAGPIWFYSLSGSMLFVMFVLPWLRMLRMFRKYSAFSRPCSISFGPEGMHLESEDASGDYKWSLFYRITETRRSFVFLVTSRGATYVPKRGLSGSAEIRVLRNLIRENFKGKKWLRAD
jgi:YcxB-like protein